jgi:hypothetical protein
VVGVGKKKAERGRKRGGEKKSERKEGLLITFLDYKVKKQI